MMKKQINNIMRVMSKKMITSLKKKSSDIWRSHYGSLIDETGKELKKCKLLDMFDDEQL